MSPTPVVVYTAAGQMHANLIKSLLEADGIPVQLVQESAGAVYVFTVGTLGMVEVLVPAERADEARALIAMLQGDETGEDSRPQ
jgi:hypothetical protein